MLVRHDDSGIARWSRYITSNNTLVPLWNDATLPSESYTDAYWSVGGAAIIASGAEQVLRIVPDTLSVQILLNSSAGYHPTAARPLGSASLTEEIVFVGQSSNGPRQLFALVPGEAEPVAVSDALTSAGPDSARIETAWDSSGTHAAIVLHAAPDATFGSPILRDAGSIRRDLSPRTGGPIADPQWGPVFVPGDPARVQTPTGDALNLRTEPGGAQIVGVVNGTRVTVRSGPSVFNGEQWWQVQTPDRTIGWLVATVRDAQGQSLRTLVPTN